MSEAYPGEIRMFAGNFAPVGWATCDGQLLNIADYSALYSLIGTTYDGDGVTNFALPDLRGRLPLHMGTNPATGTNYSLGAASGTETVTLAAPHLPTHSHPAQAQEANGNQQGPTGGFWAGTAPAAVAANPVSDKIYIANKTDNNLTVLTEQPQAVVPLQVTTQPTSGTAGSASPSFDFIALSSYSPTAPAVQHIFYQLDAWTGAWTQGTVTGSTAATTGPLSPTPGMHVVYSYATDGQAPSSGYLNAGYSADLGSATVPGQVGAYAFYVPTDWSGGSVTTSTGTATLVGTTIKVTGITLAGGTMTITDTTPTVGSTLGARTFTTTEKSTSGGTLTALASSPAVTVTAPPPTITTTSLPVGEVNVACSQTLTATGGAPPLTWSVASGSLPAGLALNSGSGVLSGLPTTVGTFTFTVTVTDSFVTPQRNASLRHSATIIKATTCFGFR